MNVNRYTQKLLEWIALIAVGFYLGSIHVAQMAYSGRTMIDGVLQNPEWVQKVSGYELPVIVIVVIATALWIGLDYYENILIED